MLKGVIVINSIERHEARYQRRRAKRLLKKNRLNKKYGVYRDIFSYDNLYKYGKKSCNGVRWKPSTQAFIANFSYNISELFTELKNETYKSRGFKEFDIIERGKKRHIKSVHISERTVQKTLCKECLHPILFRNLIYDNGALQPGRGTRFTIERLETNLHRFYRKYKTNGYVLLFDFSKYFDNINHDELKRILKKSLNDEKVLKLIYRFIDNFGEKGLGLGSEVSQICAVTFPNELDHYIKETLRIRYYGRYMDDGYLIHQDKEYLKCCLREMQKVCDKLGIILNTKKTKIVPLRTHFKFLKMKFILTDSGKVVKKVNRGSPVRMRKKLRKFKKWCESGRMSKEDIVQSYNSFIGYLKTGNSYRTIVSMNNYFYKLFKFYPHNAIYKR